VTDWTIILTTLGAAGLTGGFGYLGIRRSTGVTRKQIEAEMARTREQIEAERERLRDEHREANRQNRQGTYHNLLNADIELAGALGQGISDAQQAFVKFSYLGNGAVLFGTEAVKNAVTAVLVEYVFVIRDAKDRAGGEKPSPELIKEVFDEHAAPVQSARTALVKAMRGDVGPEEAKLLGQPGPGGEPDA
jgi:hypothetical protein